MSPEVVLSMSTETRFVSMALSSVPNPVTRSATRRPPVLISREAVSPSRTPPFVEVNVIDVVEEFEVVSKPRVISSSADKACVPVLELNVVP